MIQEAPTIGIACWMVDGSSLGDFRYNSDVDPKQRQNRRIYLETLRQMTPAARLQKAMELSELGKQLFLHRLRRRFPSASGPEIHARYLERLAKSHNRNY
jgi:hypothetical protein